MYDELVAALKATTIPFAEFAWQNAPATGSYGVIAPEYGADTQWGDGKLQQQAIAGSVDVFVRAGNGVTEAGIVQGVFDTRGISYSLNSIQFESDRNIVHWEWVFELEEL